MAPDSEVDTSRTVVQTYVPAYQRKEWDEHATELDMSRSEFVKAMVQAGRRGFGGEIAQSSDEDDTADTPSNGLPAGDTELQALVLVCLEKNDCLSWEELLSEITGDVETRLEEVLTELQGQGEITHSGRAGGYVRTESTDT